MWAAHQVHHSSEDYNLATALRQSVMQSYNSWVSAEYSSLNFALTVFRVYVCFFQIFYLPIALFVPPTQFLVHTQFNLLYQFWIHTEVIHMCGISRPHIRSLQLKLINI